MKFYKTIYIFAIDLLIFMALYTAVKKKSVLRARNSHAHLVVLIDSLIIQFAHLAFPHSEINQSQDLQDHRLNLLQDMAYC